MRICLLSARFPPDRCGVGDYTYFLGTALARCGYDVHVLTSVGGTDHALYPADENLCVHRVVHRWGVRGIPEVLRCLGRLDPQLLLIQYAPHSFNRRGLTFAVNLLPALSRVSNRTRVITNFHELYIPFHRSLKRSLGAAWQRSAALLLALGSQSLTATALEWSRRLKRIGVRKPIEVIPAGSNIPLAPISEEERVRLRKGVLGKSDGLLVAGFGARHDRDIPAVLHGLQQLKMHTHAKLLWIGGGSPDKMHTLRIEEAIRDCGLENKDVEWTGVIPHQEVSRLLSACDVMVLPFVDGVSTRRTSAVSGFQHGLPVLTTRGVSPEPWFVHGDNVYLRPIGDRQALADGLLELARHPDLRVRLSQGARELYRKRFAWEVIAHQVANLVEPG